ncbi:MAG: hypothetical protein M1812_005574 [Candelaria pacifica]|nr:MAG: hypothetical protein M1812_005574 [Candelaria pacifica]
MKITALVSVSLLALAANADDGSITCQTSNGSPQIDQAQRAISDLSGVRSELLCSAETGGFDVMKTQDSARLTISTNIPGGAGLFWCVLAPPSASQPGACVCKVYVLTSSKARDGEMHKKAANLT